MSGLRSRNTASSVVVPRTSSSSTFSSCWCENAIVSTQASCARTLEQALRGAVGELAEARRDQSREAFLVLRQLLLQGRADVDVGVRLSTIDVAIWVRTSSLAISWSAIVRTLPLSSAWKRM